MRLVVSIKARGGKHIAKVRDMKTNEITFKVVTETAEVMKELTGKFLLSTGIPRDEILIQGKGLQDGQG